MDCLALGACSSGGSAGARGLAGESVDPLPTGHPPLTGKLREPHFDALVDRDVVGIEIEEIANHAHAFVELDRRDHVGHVFFPSGMESTMRDGVGIDSPPAGDRSPIGFSRMALGTERLRIVAEHKALDASLDHEFLSRDAIPKPLT